VHTIFVADTLDQQCLNSKPIKQSSQRSDKRTNCICILH